MIRNEFIGLLCIIMGLIVLFLALGDLLFRLLLALFGLAIINYGLKMRGEPPVIVHITRWRNTFWY